jgi:hypothetical protein
MPSVVGNQLQGSLTPLVVSEDPRMQTTAQIQEAEGHIHSAKDMTEANQLLSYANHPDRLTQGIIADRIPTAP